MPIFLVGFMGCGKTVIGRILANYLNLPFFDTDTLIEEFCQKKIPDIFTQDGEAFFREKESEIIRLYPFPKECVVATGGGLPCHSSNMDYICSKGIVVYLNTPISLLSLFLYSSMNKNKRPLLSGCKTQKDVENRIKELLNKRLPFYNMAKYQIDVVKGTAAQKKIIIEFSKTINHLIISQKDHPIS